jgi:UDP-GlcNAc3NAcA epimerase
MSSPISIVTVIGARPQFVKAAVVSARLRAAGAREVLVHTGQHYDPAMSDIFFTELGLPAPAYHLGVGSGAHGAQTGRMLAAVEEVLLTEQPDWCLVYGDTNSTLAGALAAVKLHIPVAHVEAGLRSFNRRMPEEINRVLVDHAADLLFAPSDTAVAHLRAEGIPADRVLQVGDVMYDATLCYGARAQETSRVLERLALAPGRYILATVHRAENTDDPARLAAILGGLRAAAATLPVVLPLHPRLRELLRRTDDATALEGLRVIEPVGYLDMLRLEAGAAVIATDSGGVQKEAYYHRVPCVTLRDETEWLEVVETGWNRLCPPVDAATVAAAVLAMRGVRGRETALYGGGTAAARIAQCLVGDRAGEEAIAFSPSPR